MVKASSLFASLITTRGATKFSDFERVLLAFGFRHDRTKGSHRIYIHPDVPRPLSVQPRGGEAKPYQIRQFLDMVEEYGLTLSD